MKIHIYGNPHFKFSLTRAQLDVLMELSAMHYDGYCKSLCRPGPNSFLYGWSNSGKMIDGQEVYEAWAATWHHLDMCMKILECTIGLSPDEITVVGELRTSFSTAMRTASEASKPWFKEIEA